MMTKKSLAVALLTIAILLSVFSLAMSFSVDSLSPKGESQKNSDLGGNVNLVILPSQDSTAASAESGK
jgi:hypothetical protein